MAERAGGLRCAVAPAPSSPVIVDAVVAGGGVVVDPSEAEALVWTEPMDGPGLADTAGRGAAACGGCSCRSSASTPSSSIIDDSRTWTSAKGAYSEPVAEHALALGLAGLRQLPTRARADGVGRAGGPAADGRAGHHRRRRGHRRGPAAAAGALPRRHHRRPPPRRGRWRAPTGWSTVDRLHDALPGADLVVLALSLTPETEGIIGAAELDLMEPHAWLVNVARGRHVVTDDLVAALRRRSIGGAALDVTEPEPLPADHPLWDLDNCLITPHTANTWAMAEPLFARRVTENVARFGRGERAPRPGQPPPGLLRNRSTVPVSRPGRGRCTGGRP